MADAVAIYTRVSREDLEQPASTRRQERACRRYAESKGWQVADVWEDVDVSAFDKRVRRPAFEDLMTVVAGGRVNGVVVWKLDRLVRRVADFERFWVRCDAAGVFLVSATEPIDSTTDMGLAVIRILVTFANVESTSIGLRLQARMEEKARAGIPVVNSRLFGFNETCSEIVEDEADMVREAAGQFLAGESLGAIAQDWQRRGLHTPRGGEWTRGNIQRLLVSPRLVGDNTFKGAVVKENCFPPILDRSTSAQIRAVLSDHHSTRHRSCQYLLTGGLLRCSVCGSRLFGVSQERYLRAPGPRIRTRRYKCKGRPGEDHASINADFVEALIVSATLQRLEKRMKIRPRLRVPPDASERLAEVYEHHAAALRNLASDYYVHRRLTTDEWESARDELEHEMRTAQRINDPRWRPPLARNIQGLRRLRSAWDSFDLSHRRDIIASELEFATVALALPRGRVDPARVQPRWWDDDSDFSPNLLPSSDTPSVDAFDNTRWMSSTDAAVALGCTRDTILARTRSGDLEAVFAHGKFRYRRADVERIAAQFVGTIGATEVAKSMGVPPYLVGRWITKGRLPGVKRGTWYRVRLDDLEAFRQALQSLRSDLIDTKEAARLMGMTPNGVQVLAREGRLDSLRLGGVYMLRRDQVMAEVRKMTRRKTSGHRLISGAGSLDF
jgi:excisionase family DNA binding protein